MGLQQIGPMQTQFGMQMGGAGLGQANQMRMVRLSLLNDFMNNFRQQEMMKKQHERAQTEKQQSMAMGAGSVLGGMFANPLIGLLGAGGGGGAGAYQGTLNTTSSPQGMSSLFDNIQGGGTDILSLMKAMNMFQGGG